MAERAMMTAKDLAADYGFSPRHWIRLAAQGRIPGARRGCVMYSITDKGRAALTQQEGETP